jgi:hypothetical protein
MEPVMLITTRAFSGLAAGSAAKGRLPAVSGPAGPQAGLVR